MSKRELHALQIDVVAKPTRCFIVWPGNEPEKPCARLPDRSQSWLDLRAGDAVLMRSENGLWQQCRVEAVKLYRVFPTEFNGVVVGSAREWLSGD